MEDSIKLAIDVEKLKENGNENYIATDELIDSERRLQGLIKNDISFSAIVYGYRGTGKSSFVDHALKPFEDDRVIIRFNATKYGNEYNKFLKRFIRELYLTVNKNEKKENVGLWERIGKKKDWVISRIIERILANKVEKEKITKKIGKFITIKVPNFFKAIPKFFNVSIPNYFKGKLTKYLYEKNKYKSGVLKNIYRHTFFNISESIKVESERKRSMSSEISFSLSGEAGIERTVDLITIVGLVVTVANKTIIPLLNLPSQKVDALNLLIIGALAYVVNWAIKITIKSVASFVGSIATSKARTKTKEIIEESLYDDEIAEFHVFSELKKISEENTKVIFVLDELDKLNNDDIRIIISDLKALILSEDVISILVAGKNYEEYWDGEKDETDGIATNLFSQKIYVPLVDTMRSWEIVKSLFAEEDQDKLDDTLYVKKLIMKSEGVIRELINLITSDIEWNVESESEETQFKAMVSITKPVAETASDAKIKNCYLGLTRVEESVKERYREGYYAKADEMYMLAYRITRYVREHDKKLVEADRKDVRDGLMGYMDKYAKHLIQEERDLVFDKMFSEENKAENIVSTVGQYKTSDEITSSELYTIGFEFVEKRYSGILPDSSINDLQELLSDIFQVIIFFAEYMEESISTIMRMCFLWGFFPNNDEDMTCTNYEAFKRGVLNCPVSIEDFVSGFEKKPYGYYSNTVGKESLSIQFEENKVWYRSIIVEALISIYCWRELGDSDRDYVYKNRTGNIFIRESFVMNNTWDIEANDNGVLRAVEVKYYKYGIVSQELLMKTKDALEMRIDQSYQAGNAVIATFVSRPKDISSLPIEYGRTNNGKNYNVTVSFIPYNNYENFKKGMNDFKKKYFIEIK